MPRCKQKDHGGSNGVIQKMIKCLDLVDLKIIKMGSRLRYMLGAILVWTQDTIESVSHLGLIAELLRGE